MVAIKHVIPLVREKVCQICNNMLESGVYPDALKVAKVVLINKGGDEQDLNNYRPISILPLFSKVFEKIINVRLSKYLKKNGIISEAQYGFQKGKSTEMALIHIRDKMVQNFERNLYTVGIFLDLSKAFDSIHHEILLNKCFLYGIRGIAFNLIESYLSGRYQYVKMHGAESRKGLIIYGVPQGSILGPLLFLLYINDIVNIPNTPNIVLYADDTSIFFSNDNLPDLSRIANSYLKDLFMWLVSNRLRMNIQKTKFIIFRPVNKPVDSSFSLHLNGVPLERTNEIKFLGVWFHESLHWNTHVNKLARQLSRQVGAISRIRNILPKWLIKTIYYAVVYSRLYYCLLVWGNTTAENLRKLRVLQRRAVRLITNDDFFTPSARLFDNARILTLESMFTFKLGIYIYKLVKEGNLVLTRRTPLYSMRDARKFEIPLLRTNYGRQSMEYLVPLFLNKFEHYIEPPYLYSQFRRMFRSYLTTNPDSALL